MFGYIIAWGIGMVLGAFILIPILKEWGQVMREEERNEKQ